MNYLELFIEYLNSQPQQPSKLTVKNYRADVGQFIKWWEKKYGKNFDPSAISINTINTYKEERTNSDPRKSDINPRISARSVERHVSSLRKFFTFLKLEGYISHSPFEQQATSNKQQEDPYHLKDFKNNLYVYNASKLTIKNYVIDVKQFITWAEQVLKENTEYQILDTRYHPESVLSKITPVIVEEYKQRLISQEFSPLTVNRKLSSLRKYIAWAQTEGLIRKNDELRIPNIEKTVNTEYGILNTDEPNPQHSSFNIHHSTKYSKFPPLRLAQKLGRGLDFVFDSTVIHALAHSVKHGQYQAWKLRGKPIFHSVKSGKLKVKNAGHVLNTKFQILNTRKEFYAPLSVSTTGWPLHKKVIHHAKYTRPNWYRTYHSYALAHYFHFAILIIFMSAIGFSMYKAFFIDPQSQKTMAAIPTAPLRVLSFQGRLTDATDNPITAETQLRFVVYNDLSASGAARLWEEVVTITPDQDGIFNTYLGSDGAGGNAALCNSGNPPSSPATGACGIPQSLFAENAELYLGVTVGDTPELAPRQQLATVAYATNSETLQGLEPITNSANVTNVVLALDSSGDLSIGGAATPTFEATGGEFTISGNVLTLTTVAGSNSNIQIKPDGMGIIDLQKPLQNTSLNNNISSAIGSVEIDDMLSVLATSSGQSAFTINQNSTGPLISASSSGVPKFTVGNNGSGYFAGNVGIGTTSPTTSLQIASGTLHGISVGADYPSWMGNNGLYVTGSAYALSGYIVGSGNSFRWGDSSVKVIGDSTAEYIAFETNSTEQVRIDTNGNVGIGTTSPDYKLDVNGNINSTGYYLDGSPLDLSGINYWQLTSNSLSPGNSTYALNVGNTASTSAYFHAPGTNNQNAWFNLGTGNVGIGTTSPLAKLHINGGTGSISTGLVFGDGDTGFFESTDDTIQVNAGGSGVLFFNSAGNSVANANGPRMANVAGSSLTNVAFQPDKTDANTGIGGDGNDSLYLITGGSTKLTIDSSGNIGIGTTSPVSLLDVNRKLNVTSGGNVGIGTTAPGATLDLVTSASTTNGMNLSANSLTSGVAMYLSSTSTGLSSGGLMSLDWSPGSSTTATGDLFSLNIGANGNIGKLFNIKDSGSSLFSVSETSVDINLPTNFTAAGDVSMAYDLIFTNPTASYIKSSAPLYLESGETFNSSDLTLRTYNKGNTIVDSEAFVTNYAATVSGQLVVGTTTPSSTEIGGMYLTNGGTYNKALAILNQTESQDIFTASASGVTKFTIASNGNLTASGTLTGLTGLTSSGTITFSGFSTNGGLMYTNASGVLAQMSGTGTSSQCLIGNASGAPTWGDCSTAVAGSVLWTSGNGALYPKNSTLDLFVGGSATSSAKFSVLNINSGTPVASISATSTGSGLSMSGSGAIQSLRNGLFTLGGNTTGNIALMPLDGTGNVGIGTTVPQEILHVMGANATRIEVETTGTLSTDVAALKATTPVGSFGWFIRGNENKFHLWDYTTSLSRMTIDAGNVGIGTTVPFAKLDIEGGASSSGTLSFRGTTDPKINVLNGENFGIRTSVGGDTGLSERLTILNNGNVGIGTTIPDSLLHLYQGTLTFEPAASATNKIISVQNASGIERFFFNYDNNTAKLNLASDSISSIMLWDRATGNVGIGTTNPVQKLEVAGSMQGQQLIDRDDTNYFLDPAATSNSLIVAGSVGIGTTSPLTSTGLHVRKDAKINSAMVVDQLGNGNLFVASASGVTQFIIENDGDIIVGPNGTGKITASVIDPYLIQNTGTVQPYMMFQNTVTGGADDFMFNAGDTELARLTEGGNLGIGTTAPAAKLDIKGSAIVGNGNKENGSWPLYISDSINLGWKVADNNGIAKFELYTGYNSINEMRLLGDVKLTGFNQDLILGYNNSGNANTFIEGLRVNNNGNVGIGVTSPIQKLDVAGSVRVAGDILPNDSTRTLGSSQTPWNYIYANNIVAGSTGTSGFWQRNANALSPANITDDILLGATATTSALVKLGGTTNASSWFNTGGNVGIGTTNPSRTLDVNGTMNIATTLYADTIQLTGSCCGVGINFNNENMTGLNTITISDSGAAEGMQWADANWSIDNSPLDRSNAKGNLNFYGSEYNVALWRPQLWVYNASNYTTATALSTGGINFTTTGTGHISFNPGGNVGIGTTNPGTKLDVNGTSNFESNMRLDGGIFSMNGSGYFGIDAPGVLNGRFLVSDSGNVGIGITSPVYKLDVDGDINATSYYLNGSPLDLSGINYWQLNSGALAPGNITNDVLVGGSATTSALIKLGGTTNASSWFNTGGNVGIGTTNPGSLFAVGANVSSQGQLTVGTYGNVVSAGSIGQIFFKGHQIGAGYSYGSGIFQAVTDNPTGSSNLYFQGVTDGTTNFKVRADGMGYFAGNVGIGTTAPLAKLDIEGGASSSGTLSFRGTTDPKINVLNGENFGIRTSVGGDTGLSERLTILNNGNVGIGTTNPGYKLEVNGNTFINGTIYNSYNNSSVYSKAGYFTAYTNDNDTILRANGTGNIVFQDSSSSPLVTILGGGNVGIGTTAPDYKLDVNGDINSTGYYLNGSELDLSGINYWQLTDGALAPGNITNDVLIGGSATTSALVKLGGTTNASSWFNTGGNVGIGTTTPGAKLEIDNGNLNSNGLRITNGNPASGVGLLIDWDGEAADTPFQVRTNTTGGSSSADSDTKFIINGAGNVGIGTTSPQNKLQITDETAPVLRIDPGANTSVDPTLWLRDTGDTAGFKLWYNNDVGSTYFDNIYDHANGDIFFRTKVAGTAVNALTIESAGNIGIGNTTPGAKLDISGDASSSGSLVFRGTTDPKINVLNGENFGIRTSVGGDTGLSERLTILNSGNMGIGTTSPTQKLVVNGNGSQSIQVRDSASTGILDLTTSGTQSYISNLGTGGGIYFRTGGYNNRVYLDSSGNLGIGDLTPKSILSVSGNTGTNGLVTVNQTGSGDIFSASQSGNTKFLVNNAGNVGIGTTSPEYKLDVNGSVNSTGYYLNGSALDLSGINYWGLASGALYPSNNTNDILVGGSATSSALVKLGGTTNASSWFNTGGNVGIGTTNPVQKFEVAGKANIGNITSTVNGDSVLRVHTGNTANANAGIDVIRGTSWDSPSSIFSFRLKSDAGGVYRGSIGMATGSTPAEHITLNTTGNVGIGTTSPSEVFEVVGNTALDKYLYLKDYDSGTKSVNAISRDGAWQFWNGGVAVGGYANGSTPTLGTGEFLTKSNSYLSVESGNVGIGTTNPGGLLHLSSANAAKLYIQADRNNDADDETKNAIIYFGADGDTQSANITYHNLSGSSKLGFAATGSTDQLTITSGGNVGIGTTSPLSVLDVIGDIELSGQLKGKETDHSYITIAPAGEFNQRFYTRSSTAVALERLTIEGGASTSNIYFQNANVGIGTTLPGSALQVAGNITPEATGTRNLGSSSLYWNNIYVNNIIGASSGTQGYWQRNNNAISPTNISDDLLLGATATSSALIKLGGTTNATTFFNTGGNVGIGTTNPGARLEMEGGIVIDNQYSFSVGGGNTSGDQVIKLGNDAGVAYLQTVTNRDLKIGSDGYPTSIFIEGSNGRVGLNTIVPEYALDIYSGTLRFGSSEGGTAIRMDGGSGTDTTLIRVDANSDGESDSAEYGFSLKYMGSRSGNYNSFSIFADNQTGSQVEALTMLQNGYIGINNVSPLTQLDITGSASMSANMSLRGATTHTLNILDNGTLNIQRSVGGDVGLSTALFIQNNGNVGIGTTSPGYKLDVNGSINSTGYYLNGTALDLSGINYWGLNSGALYPSNTTNDVLIGGSATTSALVKLGGTTNASSWFNTGGNVGIGTTAPGAKLSIYDSATSNGDVANFFRNVTDSNKVDIYLGKSEVAGGAGIWQMHPNVAAPDSSFMGWTIYGDSDGTGINLKKGGNVGIGTITPLTKLDIEGGASSSGTLSFRGTTDPKINVLNGENFGIRTSVGGDTGLSERLTILNNGNVGIGTTNPGALFDVNGTARVTTLNAISAIQLNGTNINTAGTLSNVAYLNQANVFSANQNLDTGFDVDNAFVVADGGALTTSQTATFNGNLFFGGNTGILASGGNVGVGTTSTSSLVDIRTATTGNVDALSVESDYSATGQGAAIKFMRSNGVLARIRGIEMGSWDGGLSFEVIDTAGTTPGETAATTEAMRINQLGNVGIGTTNPGGKLEIAGGNLKMTSGNIVLNGNWLSGDGGNEGIYVDSSGRAGIGTTATSSYGLTVNGNAAANNFYLTNPGIGNGSRIQFLKTSDNAWIDVTETSSDATTYGFYMSDNPDSTVDKFLWDIADWKGAGGDWTPLEFVNLNANIRAANVNAYGDYNVYGPWYSGNGQPSSVYESKSGTLTVTPDVSGFTGSSYRLYTVEIDGAGSPNTFKFCVNSAIGACTSPVQSGVTITGAAQDLDTGVRITFNSTTGGVVGDKYQFRVYKGGHVLASNGSATAPTFSFTGDTNTGMYWGAADTLRFSTGGTDKLTILSAGNVGVGTTNPTQALSVIGDIMSSTTVSANSGSAYFNQNTLVGSLAGVYVIKNNNASGQISFNNSGAELMRLNSNGNLGIGTTDPGSRLQVAGNITPEATGTRDLGSSSLYWNNIYVNNIIGASSGTQGYWQRNGNAISPTNISDDLLLGATSTASALVKLTGTAGNNSWINTGNVGVGTTAPGAKLELYSNAVSNQELLRITNTDAGGAGGRITFAQGGNIKGTIKSAYDATNQWYLGFGTEDTAQALTIIDNGNVGIGTTNPVNTRLDVNGNVNIGTNTGGGTLYFGNQSGGNASNRITYSSNEFGLYTIQSLGMNFYTAGNNRLHIGNGGNVGIGTTAPLAKLDIEGEASASGTLSFRGTTDPKINVLNGENFGIRTSVGGDTGLTERLTILNSGYVGMGTTAPATKLEVKAVTTSNELFAITTSDYVNDSAGSRLFLGLGGNTGDTYSVIQSQDVGSTSNNNLILQQYGGNVGIGTTDPGALLDVNGTARVTTLNATSAIQLNGTSINTAGTLTNVAYLNQANAFTANQNFNAGFDVDDAFVIADGGALTTSQTANFNGAVNLGDNGDNVVVNSNTWDISGAGVASGLTGLSSSGTITFSGFSTNGGLMYTNGSGVLAQTAAGTSSQCLIGGTTPSWSDCSGVAASAIHWTSGNGALYPKNSTLDLFVGGSATSSAKFSVLNMTTGTPTASVSATTTGAGLSLGGDGKIQSLRNNLLTIGGDTTGHISLMPLNGSGYVGVGTTSPNFHLVVTEAGQIPDSSVVLSSAAQLSSTISVQGAGQSYFMGRDITNDIEFIMGTSNSGVAFVGAMTDHALTFRAGNNAGAGNTEYMRIDKGGNVGIGTTSPVEKLHLSGNIQMNNATSINFAGSSQGNDAAKLYSLGTGNRLYVRSEDTDDVAEFASYGLYLPKDSVYGLYTSGGAIFNHGDTGDEVVIQNTSGNVGIGTTAPNYNLEVIGDIYSSNIVYGKSFYDADNTAYYLDPAATGVSLKIAGDASSSGSFVFDETTGTATTIDVLNGNRLDIQTSVGGDTGLTPRLSILSNGNVGIGTTAPDYKLEVNGAINATDYYKNGTLLDITNYWQRPSNTGALSPANITDDVLVGAISTASAKIKLGGTTNASTWFNTGGNVGIGTTDPSQNLQIGRDSVGVDRFVRLQTAGGGTTKAGIKMIAGSLGEWYMQHNDSTLGFGKDSSEYLTIADGGNVGIGTTGPTSKLQVSSGAVRITSDALTGGTFIAEAADGSDWFTIGEAAGQIKFNSQGGYTLVGGAIDLGARMNVSSLATTKVPLALSGITGQTDNLFEINKTNTDLGGDAFVVDENGNVGIGTTSPTNTLEVAGTGARITGAYTEGTTNTGIHAGIISGTPRIGFFNGNAAQNWQMDNNAGTFRWYLPGVVHMSLDTTTLSLPDKTISVTGTGNNYFAGNVGIGTTSPVEKLEVASGNILLSHTYKFQAKNSVNNAADLAYVDSGNWANYAQNNLNGFVLGPSSLKISGDYNNNFIGFTANSSEAMRIISDGNVGIGTTAPVEKLQILGANATRMEVETIGALSTDVAALKATSPAGSFGWFIRGNENKFHLWDYTTSLSRMTIDAGNVGIGTTLPGEKLEVNGVIRGQKLVDVDSTNYYIDPGATDANSAFLSAGGSIGIGTTSPLSRTGLEINKDTQGNAAVVINNLGTAGNMLVASKSGVTQFIMENDGDIIIGPNGTGKITVTTIDPLYTIDGNKYSTYGTSMIGVKEEVTGKVELTYNSAEQAYAYRIELNNQPEASDLWLFSRVTDPDINLMTTLLTPDTSAKVWYKKDVATRTIILLSDSPTTVSYRFTAPRFDYTQWGNVSNEAQATGLIAPPPQETIPYVEPSATGSAVATVSAGFNIQKGFDSFGNPVYYLVDVFGNIIKKSESLSSLITANLKAGIIKTAELTADSITIAENITIAGENLRDYIVRVVLEAGLGENSTTSPIAKIDKLKTGVISPLAKDQKVTVELDGEKSKFEIRNSTNSAVATIDIQGNATFSGSLAANQASISGNISAEDATISGTIRAKKIIADQIEGLEMRAATVSAQYITNNYYLATESAQQVAQSDLNTDFINISSFSGQLAKVENLEATFGKFNEGLVALGPSSFSDVSIAGQFSIGGNMILANGGIDVLGADLEIQPLRQGGISFLSGLIKIDVDGNLSVWGNASFAKDVTVGGKLAAGVISPISDKDITLQLEGENNPNGNLKVINASGSGVFAISKQGDIEASGSATIAKLNLNLAKPALALSPTEMIATGSAGIATISARQNELTIKNKMITEKSLIYITPRGDTGTSAIYLLRQVDGESFTVGINQPSLKQIPFNWMIIN